MKILSDKPQEKGVKSWIKLNQLKLQGKKGELTREYMNSKGAVAAVVYDTTKNKYIFTKQFRPGPKKEIIEIAAGMRDHDGEDQSKTMIREIEEELGYKTDTINVIVKSYYTSPGHSNETMIIYFATVSKKIGKGGGLEEENEEIEIVEMTKEEIKRTEFIDGKTLLSLSVLKLK
jgi:ADP-ribose pyrophosphatase